MKPKENLEGKLMDIIINERLDNALDDVLQRNVEYQQSERLKRQKCDGLQEIGMTEEQWEKVEDAIVADNACCAIYGELAYRKGFRDGIKNMKKKPEGKAVNITTNEEGDTINAILGNVLRKDAGYQQAEQLKRKKYNRLRKIRLKDEQWEKVKEVLAVNNLYRRIYGELAYQQGFRDGERIVSELKRLL